MKSKQRAGVAGVAGLIAGLVLAPGTVQAAINYFDVTKVVTGSGSASCPSGWRATGGGFTMPDNYYGSLSSTEYFMQSSYPDGTTRWRVKAYKVTGNNSASNGWRFSKSAYYPPVKVVCVQ